MAKKADDSTFLPDVYEVAEGKSFSDIADISKVWNAGDDVSHFAADRLEKLLELGLITKK